MSQERLNGERDIRQAKKSNLARTPNHLAAALRTIGVSSEPRAAKPLRKSS